MSVNSSRSPEPDVQRSRSLSEPFLVSETSDKPPLARRRSNSAYLPKHDDWQRTYFQPLRELTLPSPFRSRTISLSLPQLPPCVLSSSLLPKTDRVQPPLRGLLVVAYGVGHHLNDLCAACWFTYLLLYLKSSVVGMGEVHAGFVLLSGQIADGLTTPAVGLLIA